MVLATIASTLGRLNVRELLPIKTKPITAVDVSHPIRLGVEQEFELFAEGTKLDFRNLFQSTIAPVSSVPFRDRDTAVILDAGYMLACDEKEAEFATSPIPFQRDGCIILAKEVQRCRNHMFGLLNKIGINDVRGYSTHLNVNAPRESANLLASLAAVTVGPALVLLLEAATSPGLLIRPRRNRLEIGSEYVHDEQALTASAVFLAGALSAFLRDGQTLPGWPRVRLGKWEAGTMRGGMFLPHDAYGESIHARGRAARLTLEDGQTTTAGDLLERCADLALVELDGQIDTRAEDALRAAVCRPGSLQIERGMLNPRVSRRRVPSRLPDSARTLHAIASIPPSWGAIPRFVDWEGAAFTYNKIQGAPIVGTPWSEIPSFIRLARKGNITPLVGNVVPAGTLANLEQLASPHVYEKVDTAALGDQAFHDVGKSGIPSGKGGVPSGKFRGGKRTTKPSESYLPLSTIPQLQKQTRRNWLPLLLIPLGIIIIGGLVFNTFGSTLSSKDRGETPSSTVLAQVDLPIQPIIIPPIISPTPSLTPTSTSTPTMTPTSTATPTMTPTSTSTPTNTPTSTSVPCVPPPNAFDPPDLKSMSARNTVLRWKSDYALKSDEVFDVLVSTDGGSTFKSIGTTRDTTFPIDFLKWDFAGVLGDFSWTIRVRDASGKYVSCESKWLSFTLTGIPSPQQPAPAPGPGPAPCVPSKYTKCP